MELKTLIARINALAAKKKNEGLNAEELSEQAALRRLYLDNIKAQVQAQLDCIEIADDESAPGRKIH